MNKQWPSVLAALAFVVVLLCSSLSSCSKSGECLPAEAESASTQQMLNDMLSVKYSDKEALARCLETTPSVLERLAAGKTLSRPEFERKIRKAYGYFITHGRKFNKLRAHYEDFKWWQYVTQGWKIYPVWFWIVVAWLILWIIPCIFVPVLAVDYIGAFLLVLVSLLCSAFHRNKAMEDPFTSILNSEVEYVATISGVGTTQAILPSNEPSIAIK